MVELNVCVGTSCHLNGSYNVVQSFQQLIEKFSLHDDIEFKASFCMKKCDGKGVSVQVDGESFRVMPEQAEEFFLSRIAKKISL